MKLHSVFITYNRLELTKRAIESYLETVSVPHTLLVMDNASTDGTQEWLADQWFFSFFIDKNRYPGYATNAGWEMAPADASHLHRADNDFEFLPGWCEEVERRFRNKKVGQVGLLTAAQEDYNEINTGGNCVIRRELWDKGLRFDERPWPEYDVGWTEDALLSPAVEKMGYRWTRVQRPCIQPLDAEDPDDPYYIKSWKARGILDWALERHGR